MDIQESLKIKQKLEKDIKDYAFRFQALTLEDSEATADLRNKRNAQIQQINQETQNQIAAAKKSMDMVIGQAQALVQNMHTGLQTLEKENPDFANIVKNSGNQVTDSYSRLGNLQQILNAIHADFMAIYRKYQGQSMPENTTLKWIVRKLSTGRETDFQRAVILTNTADVLVKRFIDGQIEGGSLRLANLDDQHRKKIARVKAEEEAKGKQCAEQYNQQYKKLSEQFDRHLRETYGPYFAAAQNGISAEEPLTAVCPDPELKFTKELQAGDFHYDFQNCGLVEELQQQDALGAVAWLKYEALPRLRKDQTINPLRFPFALNLEKQANILVSESGMDSAAAQAFLQSFVWRFLSGIPLGKLQVGVIDPERRGAGIAPFLEMKREIPSLFDGEIRTSGNDIRSYLEELNTRMDTAIQNHLAGTAASMIAYNEENPEIAEPLTLLVINDFPSGFDGQSMDLLAKLIREGNQCGLYFLIHRNETISAPQYTDFDGCMSRLREHSAAFAIRDGKCTSVQMKLEYAMPAPVSKEAAAQFTSEYKARSKTAAKRGIVFERILGETHFAGNSADLLSIPLGIGDGGRVVPLILGSGTSNHGLVTGQTGSGKSVLLHTMIMSSLMTYGPDELHLYLMDFKSGTEFKIYDHYRIPQIKCLALDSMQEFGESVLEELDREYQERAILFRNAGVSDIAGYRAQTGKKLPRILIIIDEFQGLFSTSENKKIAQHCAELVKNIVEKGRAFGFHLIMSTQSIAGSISAGLVLDSAALEQFAVRISLQSSDRDLSAMFGSDFAGTARSFVQGPAGSAALSEAFSAQAPMGLRVAHCPSEEQESFLSEIAAHFAEYNDGKACISFEGNRIYDRLSEYTDTASKWPEARIGRLIQVSDEPHKITFNRMGHHNVLICGNKHAVTRNLMNLFLFDLVRRSDSEVYAVDGRYLAGEDSDFAEAYDACGNFHNAETEGDVLSFVKTLYDAMNERRRTRTDTSLFFVVNGLQYAELVQMMLRGDRIDESDFLDEEEADGFSVGNEEESGFTEDAFDFGVSIFGNDAAPKKQGADVPVGEMLRKLILNGTRMGIHFIFSAEDYALLQSCMDRELLGRLSERFLFALSERDTMNLTEDFSVAALRENTVYYTDGVKKSLQIIPYRFPEKAALAQFLGA